MNGRQAKKLRRLSGVKPLMSQGLDKKKYKKIRHSEFANYWLGVRTQVVLNSASWVYYKKLKKNYTAT